MLYSDAVPDLLELWTLDALQCVATAGHRLHFSEGLRSRIETRMIKAALGLSCDELCGCLLWALAMEHRLLQQELARLIAEHGPKVHLEDWFPDDRLLVVVQAFQAQMDKAASVPIVENE